MAFRRKNHFKFTEKTQSKRGIISLCVAGVLLVIYIIFVALAYKSYGELSMYFGSVGLLAILVTVVNLVTSFLSIREENSYKLIPHIAMLVTLIDALCWIGTLVIGIRA